MLRSYREGVARPAAQSKYHWDDLIWAVLARDKQTSGERPKPPAILTHRD